MTCFPDNESCLPHAGPEPVGSPTRRRRHDDLPDLAGVPNPVGGIPVGGPVGPTGGTVDRLFFGFTGDTRPDDCGGAYPTASSTTSSRR